MENLYTYIALAFIVVVGGIIYRSYAQRSKSTPTTPGSTSVSPPVLKKKP